MVICMALVCQSACRIGPNLFFSVVATSSDGERQDYEVKNGKPLGKVTKYKTQ